MKQKIALASDHRGFELKEKLKPSLEKKDFEVTDCGTGSAESCDYPDFMFEAARKVGSGECARAIGICHSGIGSSIAANKVKSYERDIYFMDEDLMQDRSQFARLLASQIGQLQRVVFVMRAGQVYKRP